MKKVYVTPLHLFVYLLMVFIVQNILSLLIFSLSFIVYILSFVHSLASFMYFSHALESLAFSFVRNSLCFFNIFNCYSLNSVIYELNCWERFIASELRFFIYTYSCSEVNLHWSLGKIVDLRLWSSLLSWVFSLWRVYVCCLSMVISLSFFIKRANSSLSCSINTGSFFHVLTLRND